jgi:hypothetical protein
MAARAARAQQARSGDRVSRVGILNYATAQDSLVDEFRTALRDLGRVEGPGLVITYRWAGVILRQCKAAQLPLRALH